MPKPNLSPADEANVRKILGLCRDIVRHGGFIVEHGAEIGFTQSEVASFRACVEYHRRMGNKAAEVLGIAKVIN